MLNKCGEYGYPCLVPDFWKKVFWLISIMSMIVSCGPLLCWSMFPLCPLSGEFFIINGCWILSKAFSASTEMIIGFLFFSLLMWWLTDLLILKNTYILGINHTRSWCMILLMYCWFKIANITLRIFASMFISDIGL